MQKQWNNFDVIEQKKLADFYEKKVSYVTKRLHAMGANMPDPLYKIEATFYVLGDFSDLFGLKLPEKSYRVFEKTGLVTTDEELAYYLLFTDDLMIAPLSYFGLSENSGFFRITCSANETELEELMDRLEYRLIYARQIKKTDLIKNINKNLPDLKSGDAQFYKIVTDKISLFLSKELDCLTLKKQIHALDKIKLLIRFHLKGTVSI